MKDFKTNNIKNVLSIAVIFIVIGFCSCSGRQNEEIVFSKSFQDEQWGRFDDITVSYNVVKAPVVVDLIMEITVSEDFPSIYPYYRTESAFAFCMVYEGPDGSRRAREYNYSLKDRDGNWKSEKTDGFYNFQFPLISEMNINEIGECKFNIENKYPRDPLCGIKSMTLKCVSSKAK